MGPDGTIVSFGAHLETCMKAAEQLKAEGLNVGVINARFCKPLDVEVLSSAIKDSPFVVTVEEGMLMGGFGSALLEMANEQCLNTSHIRRLGIPDVFVEHGDRGDLLDDVKLSQPGIVATCKEMAEGVSSWRVAVLTHTDATEL